VYHVHNRDELFHAYDQTGQLCMMYQKAVNLLLCGGSEEGAYHAV
jgi:hypothetical protein